MLKRIQSQLPEALEMIAEAQEELVRRARLPALGALPNLSEAEWAARSQQAGLLVVFDTTGRAGELGDDAYYDKVEAAMKAEGRDPAAFAQFRPPRRNEPPRFDPYGPGPDPWRRGPPDAVFALRVHRTDGGCEPIEIRAYAEKERWASLHRERGPSGLWATVPEARFETLLRAVHDVWGEGPRLDSEYTVVGRIAAGGACGVCDRPIYDRAFVFVATRPGSTDRVVLNQMHFGCAYRVAPESLTEMIDGAAFLRDDPSLHDVAKIRKGGPLGRCAKCGSIVRKTDWQMVGPYISGAYHLECALEERPEGFLVALAATETVDDREAWLRRAEAAVDALFRAKKAARRGPSPF